MDRFDEIDEVVLSNEEEIVNIISNYISIKKNAKNIIPDLELEYENVKIKITQMNTKVFVYATISEGDMYNEVIYEYKGESIVKLEQNDPTYFNSLGSFLMYISIIDFFIVVILFIIYYYIANQITLLK